MLNVIIIDKNKNSKDFLENFLNKYENTQIKNSFDNLNSIEITKENLDDIDLIIFDIDSNNADESLKLIKKIKDKFKNISFIALSYEINSELVTKTLKEGIRDFLLKPLIPAIFEATIKKIENEKNDIKEANSTIINIFSQKGGVGKTSLAINLAYQISTKTSQKVCILDFSFNSEDICTFLNIKPKFNIDFIVNNIETSDEKLLLSLMDKYQNTNLYVFSPQKDINIGYKYTPQKIIKIINSLKNIFPYIVIDSPNIIDETTMAILNNSNVTLLIGMLNMASVRNLQKCYELFDNIGYKNDKIKLIINRYIEKSDITIKDLEDTIKKKVYFKIPNNYLTLIDAINLGKTVEETNPQSNIAKAYGLLSQELINTDFSNTEKLYNHGVFNLLRRMGE